MDIKIENHPPQPAPFTCETCEALCCRLRVFLEDDRGIPHSLTEVDSFGSLAMRRLADGWCAALDRNTMRCTIYAQRPRHCREYEMGGSDCLLERAAARGE